MRRYFFSPSALCRASVVVLALALAAPGVTAQAQTDGPRGEAASSELLALSRALRAEGIERAVHSIADRLDRAGSHEKAERVRGFVHPKLAFIKSHVDADLESTMKDLFASEVSAGRLAAADLKVGLDVFRAWKTGYRIRAIDANSIPGEVSAFTPERSRGYPAEVAAIDNRAPHSMHDLRDYLGDRFTNAALDRLVARGRVVEVHVGSTEAAFADLHNRGWHVAGEIRAPNGNYERMFLAEAPNGDVRYVITGTINGHDRLRHLTALLRFAGSTGNGVRNDRLEIVGNPDHVLETNENIFREGFSRLTHEGEVAIIGFRMGLKNEITRRALARASAEHLRDELGEDPYLELKRKLRAERNAASGSERTGLDRILERVEGNEKLAEALRLSPRSIFLSADLVADFLDAEKLLVELSESSRSKVLDKLVSDGNLRVRGGGSVKDYVATRWIDNGLLRAEELLVRTNEGVRSVLLVNNYYGDTMGSVVRGLLGAGRRRIAYFGTAGGISEGVRVGDVHVPREIYDHENRLASSGVRNRMIEELGNGSESSLGDRLRLGTRLGNVFSPAVETMEWLEDARSRGIDAVEVENSYITRAIGEHNAGRWGSDRAEYYAAVTISDVPASESTLGNSNGSTTTTFRRMTDHYLRALGIDNVLLRDTETDPREPLPPNARSRRAREVADRMVPRRLSHSSLLRDRLARILEGADPDVLEDVDATRRVNVSSIPDLDSDVRRALEAEVNNAYTDRELLTSLDRANAVVSRLAEGLREAHPNGDFELRLGGGIERGDYSPAEGLILEVRGSNAARERAAALLPDLAAATEGAPTIRLAEAGGEAISLGRGEVFRLEPNTLPREHASALLENRGIILRSGSVDYAGAEHRRNDGVLVRPEVGHASGEDLARLTIPELLVRARRATGRSDLPFDRAALVAAITGERVADVERRHTELRRVATPSRPTERGRSVRGIVDALTRGRTRDRTRRSRVR